MQKKDYELCDYTRRAVREVLDIHTKDGVVTLIFESADIMHVHGTKYHLMSKDVTYDDPKDAAGYGESRIWCTTNGERFCLTENRHDGAGVWRYSIYEGVEA